MTNNTQHTQKYEIMAIIVNSLDEKQAEKQMQESLIDRIKEMGGSISFEDFWGSRGFAYRIKKQTWGYYAVLQFQLAPLKITEFKKDLSIDTKIVRFLITKVDPRDPAPKKYEDMKKEWEALEKEKKIAEIDKPKKYAPGRSENRSAHKETVKAPEEKKEKVVDNNLDKILEDSSLDL